MVLIDIWKSNILDGCMTDLYWSRFL